MRPRFRILNSQLRSRRNAATSGEHMTNTWDYIVIGAGHNGLVAACTLAMAGKPVLVVEQRALTGGLSFSHALVKGAPNHLLSVGAMDDALMAHSSLLDIFKLRDYGYSAVPLQAPYGWMGGDGETLLLHANFERTVEEIRYFSPKDAQTYLNVRSGINFVMGALERYMPHHPARMPKREWGKMLLGMATDKTMRNTLGRMLAVSAFEMISETFESEAMRGLWAYWSCMFAPATVQGSGMYLSSFGSVHRARRAGRAVRLRQCAGESDRRLGHLQGTVQCADHGQHETIRIGPRCRDRPRGNDTERLRRAVRRTERRLLSCRHDTHAHGHESPCARIGRLQNSVRGIVSGQRGHTPVGRRVRLGRQTGRGHRAARYAVTHATYRSVVRLSRAAKMWTI